MGELTLAGNGMVMPSKYVEIDREEMTYIEGGFKMKTENVAYIIDGIAVLATFGVSLSLNATKFVAKIGLSKIKKVVTEFISKKWGFTEVQADKAFDCIKFFGCLSIGGMVAAGLDYIDKNGYNGTIYF